MQTSIPSHTILRPFECGSRVAFRLVNLVKQRGSDQDLEKMSLPVAFFNAELTKCLMRTSAEDGHEKGGIRVTPIPTEIIIRATRTRKVLGEKGRQIRELTSVVQGRYRFSENSVELFVERVANRASCAMALADSMASLFVELAAVSSRSSRKMAKGCEMVISGSCAPSVFKDRLTSTGETKNHCSDHAACRPGEIHDDPV